MYYIGENKPAFENLRSSIKKLRQRLGKNKYERQTSSSIKSVDQLNVSVKPFYYY